MRFQSSFNWAFSYLLALAWLSGVVNAGGEATLGPRPQVSFYSSRLLDDGEQQRVIHYGGVTAKETSALVPATHNGLRLLQVTDGRHLITAVLYADYQLKDCEYVRDRDAVTDFLGALSADFEAALQMQRGGNGSGGVTHGGGVINLKLLRHSSDLFPESRRLVDYRWIRKECKSLHNKMKEVMREATDASASRKKRELFIYPGTNWCGVGSATDGFNELGWNAAADRCCRQHDHCPYIIESFSKKYNLFNYRFHTLSHCECDERFRTCLKMVNNAPSNLVGKLFFNVVQMKCFELKSEKTCVKRSWWGRCLKYDKQVQAHERDVLTY